MASTLNAVISLARAIRSAVRTPKLMSRHVQITDKMVSTHRISVIMLLSYRRGPPSFSLFPPRGSLLSSPKNFSSAAHNRRGPLQKVGAPAGDGRQASRGKLVERIEVEFGPFRPTASRRAECLLVALPTSWGLLLRAKHLFVAARC